MKKNKEIIIKSENFSNDNELKDIILEYLIKVLKLQDNDLCFLKNDDSIELS